MPCYTVPALIRPVPGTKNAELQTQIAKKLKTKKISVFPGERVNVFVRENLCLLAQSALLVSLKTDGYNYMLAGLALSKTKMQVYLVNRRYQFSPLALIRKNDGIAELPKSFLLNGELAKNKKGHWVFQTFDVLLVKNACVKHRDWVNRLKLYPLLQPFLNVVTAHTKNQGPVSVDFVLKPFYDPRSSLAALLAPDWECDFETDGLIFAHTGMNQPSLKWKPTDQITVDFLVGADGVSLYLMDSEECRGTLVLGARPATVVECLPAEKQPDPSAWTWKAVGYRDDKVSGNGTTVWRRNIELIDDNIRVEELTAAASQMVAKPGPPEPKARAELSEQQAEDNLASAFASQRRLPAAIDYGSMAAANRPTSPNTAAALQARKQKQERAQETGQGKRPVKRQAPHFTQPPSGPGSAMHSGVPAYLEQYRHAFAPPLPPLPPPPSSEQESGEHDQGNKDSSSRYFAPSGVAVRRQESSSKAMKGFHNVCVKDALYSRYLHGSYTLLELGIGRGADVRRIRKHGENLEYVLGVDLDMTALTECQRRWSQAVEEKNGGYTARGGGKKRGRRGHHDQEDRCRCDKIDVLELDLNDVDAAMQCFQGKERFDVVMCQFMLHYCWRNLSSTLLETVAYGGYFVATFFDWKMVDALVPRDGQIMEWAIQGRVQTRIRRISGDKIGVYVDTIGKEHVEELVNADKFLQSLPAEFESVEFCRPFTSFGSPSTDWYGPDNPMWSFTALYTVLVLRRVRPMPKQPRAPTYSPTSGQDNRVAYSPGSPGYRSSDKRKHSPSPDYRRSPSPDYRHRRSPSPDYRHRRSPNPGPRRSPSPDYRHRRSPSPGCRHRRSPSPGPRRSPSPGPRRSPSPGHRRSPNPGPRRSSASPDFRPQSPNYAAASPPYSASSPPYSASSPVYRPSSPATSAGDLR